MSLEIGVDDRITKEQFRACALSAIDSVTSVTDEIWESSLVTVVIRLNNNYEVVVGIRDAENPEGTCD